MTLSMMENYVHWFADSEVTRYMSITNCPTLKQEQEWFDRTAASETDVLWAILVNGKHIGSTGLHQISWRDQRSVSGNMIGEKSEWGKGFGSEAVRLRTRYAFTQTTLEKLESFTFLDNVGSRRCLEKAGYRSYGVKRHETFRDGKWHDMWLADILRSEWPAGQTAAERPD